MRWTATIIFAVVLPFSALVAERPPTPLNLEPGWWSYFEGEEERQHLEQFIAQMEALQFGDDAELKILKERVLVSAVALLQAEREPPAELYLPPVLQESYNLHNFLDLAKEEQRFATLVEKERAGIAARRTELGALRTRIDALMVRYLQLAPTDRERLAIGLRLMASRLSLELGEQRLVWAEERLAQDRELLGQLRATLETGMHRLSTEGLDGAALAEARDQAEGALLKAQERLLELEFNQPGNGGSEAEHALWVQRRRNAQLDEMEARTAWVFASLSEVLHQVISGRTPTVGAEQLRAWRTELSPLRSTLAQVEAATLQEQIHAAKSDANALREERLAAAQEGLVAVQEVRSELVGSEFLLKAVIQQMEAAGHLNGGLVGQLSDRVGPFWERLNQILDTPLFSIQEVPFTLYSILKIALIFIGLMLTAAAARWLLLKLTRHTSHITPAQVYQFSKLIKYALLLLAFVWSFTSIGLSLDKLFLIFGALSIGIGFGLRNLANNFVSGLILLFSKNLRVGDYVTLHGGDEGRVQEVNIHNSVIRTFDGIEVIVPNSLLTGNQLINWNRQDPYRRMRIRFGVAHGTDKELVRQVALEVADRMPVTVKEHRRFPNPEVRLTEIAESSLDFELLVWISLRQAERFYTIAADYLWEVETALRKAGIRIPFPQVDVHLDQSVRKID